MKQPLPIKPTSAKSSPAAGDDALFVRIHALVLDARRTVARGVDLVQVRTCFEIGRHIVEHAQQGQGRAAYGQALLKGLAERLTQALGRGFAKSNLEYMRRFYLAYEGRAEIAQLGTGRSVAGSPAAEIAQFPTGQSRPGSGPIAPFSLSWTHYVFLLGISNDDERSFYEIEAAEQGWNLGDLRRQFDSGLYERLALSRDKVGLRQLAQKGQVIARPEDLLKDPLVLEFLGLDERERYSESDLEAAVINQIGRFLLELGKGFLFEARQKRFSFDGDHFFVDLVFYNRLLRCYVLVDLKLGKLTHQDLGQMQMYVNYFDRFVKTEGENPTVGIVLCKKKNEALVEITLPADANIHAREYRLYLPSKEELRQKLQEWAGDLR